MTARFGNFTEEDTATVTREDIHQIMNLLDKGDREYFVRKGIALECFLHDDAYVVRCALAEEGHFLDVLIDDENPVVRATVAAKGYGLDKLIHDPSPFVRDSAQYEIDKNRKKSL